MPKKLLRSGTKMHGGGPEKQVKKSKGSDKSGGKQEFDGRSFHGRQTTVRGGIPNRAQGQTVYWGDAR